MSPTDRASILSQLNDDLASVKKSSEPLDDEKVKDQLKDCQDDFDKCAAYISDLFNQLDKGTTNRILFFPLSMEIGFPRV